MATENMDYLFEGVDEPLAPAVIEETKRKEKKRIAELPTFDTKEQAVEAGIEMARKKELCEIWQEPGGGKFLVAVPDAYEALWRHKYKKVMEDVDLYDLARKRRPVKKAITYAQARKTK